MSDQLRFDFSKEPRQPVSIEAKIIAEHPDKFRFGFEEWISENRHVWREFARVADQLWDRGRRRWASSSIIYYIRLRTALHETSGEWKINQNNARDLASLYVILKPDRIDFFEFRLRADTIRCRGEKHERPSP